MRILIDIGHPAHVHYFKNFIKIMEDKGHEFFISARDKEVTHNLLNAYNIKFFTRGKGKRGIFGKLVYLLLGDFKLLKFALNFKPDIFLSFGSSYAAHSAFILRKPHISFDDTEHAKLEHILYVPFTEVILTPNEFKKNFGPKHIRFDSTMDIAYLHPKFYKCEANIFKKYGLIESEKIFLVRFVSWSASHDKGYNGLTIDAKFRIVSLLEKYGQVIISSEADLPEQFLKYKVKILPQDMHDLLYYSDLFIGESGSMATEASVLGTPSIIVNTSVKHFGVFERLMKYNNLFSFTDENAAIKKVEQLLFSDSKKVGKNISNKIIEDSINLTDFMVWFIENYPNSFKTLTNNPKYQYNFR